jgi:hypothetical protein
LVSVDRYCSSVGVLDILSKRYCPVNSKRGRYYAQIIRDGKLEARLFFFLNFKRTPLQEEHKTIFSGLTICKMASSDLSDFTAIFRFRKITYRYFINSEI